MSTTEYPSTPEEMMGLMAEARPLVERMNRLLSEWDGELSAEDFESDSDTANIVKSLGLLFIPMAESASQWFPDENRELLSVMWGYTIGFAYARRQAEEAREMMAN